MRKVVPRYIAAVVLSGILAAVGGLILGPAGPVDVLSLVLLLAAMVVSIWTPLRYHRHGGVQALHMNDGILVAMLFVVPAGLIPLVTMLAGALGNLRSRDRTKIAFNAGAHALSATVATLAFRAVGPGVGALAPRSILAVLAAAVAFHVWDIAQYARLFAWLEHKTVRSIVVDLWQVQLISVVGNVLTGLLLAFVVVTDHAASLFAFVLVVGTHLGYRGYALALAERNRNASLQQVTRRLMEAVIRPQGTSAYLAAVAELFDADGVELLVLGEDNRRYVHRRGAEPVVEGSAVAAGILAEALRRGASVEVTEADGGALAEWLQRLGYENGVAAPVTYHGMTVAALAVFDRRGLELTRSNDPSLLASLANEAAIALKNVELFESVERERSLLAQETHKLQDILDTATDGIALIDGEGRIASWNPAMAEATGITFAEASGQPWYMALRLRDSSGDELAVDGPGPMQAAMQGLRDHVPHDLQVLRRDGEWRWLRCTFSPVQREGEGVAGVVVMARDVTVERETEQMKQDFIATVSHELRTPLTPLKGFLLTILNAGDRLGPEDIANFHESMLRQVDRLENLVGDLLVASDLDRGGVRLRADRVDLAEVAEQAADIERPPTEPERIEVVAHTPVVVLGDPAAIARILRALISNAIKHTSGQVVVSVSSHDGEGIVTVTDEGPGIPSRYQQRVFERFARLGDHLTRSTQGPGLGLAIARSLAERLGGRLTLDSRLGEGTTFTLALPAAERALTG